jgi:hypothetical protein
VFVGCANKQLSVCLPPAADDNIMIWGVVKRVGYLGTWGFRLSLRVSALMAFSWLFFGRDGPSRHFKLYTQTTHVSNTYYRTPTK